MGTQTQQEKQIVHADLSAQLQGDKIEEEYSGFSVLKRLGSSSHGD